MTQDIINRNYELVDVRREEDLLLFYIKMNCEDPYTKAYFLDSCMEGVYLQIDGMKYQVYSQVSNELIVGEMMLDSFKDSIGKSLKLIIKNRIDNQYYDYYIIPSLKDVLISLSHLENYIITRSDGYSFCFEELKKTISQNPLKTLSKDSKIFSINDVNVSNSGIDLLLDVKEDFLDHIVPECSDEGKDNLKDKVLPDIHQEIIRTEVHYQTKNLCLIWESAQKDTRSYFSTFEINKPEVTVHLSIDEIEDALRYLTGKATFFLYVMDESENKYPIVYEGEEASRVQIPSHNFDSVLVQDPNKGLTIEVDGTIFFELNNITKNGDILFALKKRSYPLKLMRIIAQRVNTELEYDLPFITLEESAILTHYKMELKFCLDDIQFIPGVHQLWIDIQDGVKIVRYPIKIRQQRELHENIFLLTIHPLVTVDNILCDVGYYTDGTGNLKCSIVRKTIKTKVLSVNCSDDEFICEMKIYPDPYLRNVTNITLCADNGDSIQPEFQLCKLDDRVLYAKITCPMSDMDIRLPEQSYAIHLFFDQRELPIIVENNYQRPSVNGREAQKKDFLRSVNEKGYKRFWSDCNSATFRLGVSEDLKLAEILFANLNDGILQIGINVNKSVEIESVQDIEPKVILKNKLNKKEYIFPTVQLDDFISCSIPISSLCISADQFSIPLTTGYLPYIELSDGVISYFQMGMGNSVYNAYSERKKIIFKKIDGSLQIDVQEMFLYEDPSQVERCTKIIEEAKNEAQINSRKVWLIGENYGLSARDNGLAFFEYCMKNKSDIEAEVYYITKPENIEIDALIPYMSNVIKYDSDEHIYLDEIAEFYIVSHGVRDVLPSLFHNNINQYRHPIIYLQHGITAMKKNYLSNTSYGSAIRKFIVASSREMLFLVKNNQFWPEEIAITGFARYDKLQILKQDDGNDNYIWISPTYRDWLIKSEKEFCNSAFYQKYSALLSDQRLINFLKEKKQTIKFSLHNDFEKYRHLFDCFENDVVHITDIHQESISNRIRYCKMMITDYSSIVFDVVYLGKPAIFFQFDRKEYNSTRGSYIDMEVDLPGPVLNDTEEVIEEIIGIISRDYSVEEKYLDKASRYYDFHDSDNSKRIYQTIIECRETV